MRTDEAVRALFGGFRPLHAFLEEEDETQLDFPVPVYVSEELGAEGALSLWRDLREHGPVRHLLPVLVSAEAGLFEEVWDWNELCEEARGAMDEASAAASSSAAKYVEQVEDQLADESLRAVLRRGGVETGDGVIEVDLETLDDAVFELHRALQTDMQTFETSAAGRSGLILLPRRIPRDRSAVETSWELPEAEQPWRVHLVGGEAALVPLVLGWGFDREDWRTRAGSLRHWHRKWGTELVALGRDTMQFYVPRPPKTLPDVRDCVLEQLAFCEELLQADTPSIEALYNVLGCRWSFWWD